MTVYWHKLLAKLFFWLMAEVVLNTVGLDNMADYSEFLYAHPQAAGRETLTEQIQFPLKTPHLSYFTIV